MHQVSFDCGLCAHSVKQSLAIAACCPVVARRASCTICFRTLPGSHNCSDCQGELLQSERAWLQCMFVKLAHAAKIHCEKQHLNYWFRYAENVIKPGAQQAADKLDDTAKQVRDELPKKADEASDKIKQQTKQAADKARDTANNPPDLQGRAKKATDKLGQ